MGPHNRRGHTSSSSSSSSFSSKRISGITSPVLANSSFLSLDYFAPPNSPASTSTAPAVLKNTTHSRLVTVATFTDSPIMSFPEVHPFIYTSPNTPESSTMKSPDSPSGSSISGSDYHGIGLAAMTASPGSVSSTSASPSPDEPRVLGSTDSDATVVKIETGSNETPMADGSKSRLAVQLATVQFPQPKIINYARPFRVSQQQQEVPSLPSLTSSSPCAVSTDQPPTPDFGAAPVTEQPFQLITPDMALLGSSTQRQRRLRHKTASLSPTSTVSSGGPITPHETPELDQSVVVVPDVPTWTAGIVVTEGKGLGIDKVQQGHSGVTWIEPVLTDSEPELEHEFNEPTPKAIDTRRRVLFDPVPEYEGEQTKAVDEASNNAQEIEVPVVSVNDIHRASAFVATAMILESYEDVPDSPSHSSESTSSSSSSVAGDMSTAFEYTSMLSSSSMASLDSVPNTAADVRDMRQAAADLMNEIRNQSRSTDVVSMTPHSTPSSTSAGTSTATSSRSVSGSGSKIKRKAVPVYPDLEVDDLTTKSQSVVDLESSTAQRAFYGVRAAAQSVPVLSHSNQPISRVISESTSTNSLSSILTASSESQTQLRTPITSSATALPTAHTSISSTISAPGSITPTQAPVQVKHVPREFHVNVVIQESAPAALGGSKRGEAPVGGYMTRREAAELKLKEQEEKDKAAKVSGASIRRTFGKMFRSVS